MARSRPAQPSTSNFTAAARRRWQWLGEELCTDISEFNARRDGANFVQVAPAKFRVSNLRSGLELTITADFDGQIIRYSYEQVSHKSAGAPEGGMLSMRQGRDGKVEFFSADQHLTSEEMRKILLEPLLFPPEKAA